MKSPICVLMLLPALFLHAADPSVSYEQALRPQFHFTAPQGWLNDPNGLVFYKGEYHLFYQHNPRGTEWVNDLSWGHAISRDLLHWEHLPAAVPPTPLPNGKTGGSWSGTGIVDWKNSAGFQTGTEKPLVVAWTATDFGQCLAYSNDRGRTFTKFSGNPVLPKPAAQTKDWDRDPKLVWHEPTGRWIMVLSISGKGFDFFSSPNLKEWTYLSTTKGLWECPEFFELAVDSGIFRRGPKKWALMDASSKYFLGSFDGTNFTSESGPHVLDSGKNFYAAQTWSDVPRSDERRIIVGWMRGGKYPGMPFNQQMGIPSELKLRHLPEGLRLTKLPVKEIESLRGDRRRWKNVTLAPGTNLLAGITGDTFDIVGEFMSGAGDGFEFNIRGTAVRWETNALSCLGKSVPVKPRNERVRWRLLVDRTSIEVFANDGEASMSFCFVPPAENRALELKAIGRPMKVSALDVYRVRSVWSE